LGSDLERLGKIQKDAARVVTDATARCNTELLMRDVAWPSPAARRQSNKLTLFYNMVNLTNFLPIRVGVRSQNPLLTKNRTLLFYFGDETGLLSRFSPARSLSETLLTWI